MEDRLNTAALNVEIRKATKQKKAEVLLQKISKLIPSYVYFSASFKCAVCFCFKLCCIQQ